MSREDDGRGVIDSTVLEQILEITRQLATPFELKEVLSRVVDAGRAVLDAERGTVFLYDNDSDELVSHVATGDVPLRFPADRGIAGECARTRQIINVPDCYADPRFNPELDRQTGYRTRCLLTLPLIGYDDSLVGVFQLLNKRKGVFDARDERIAITLAAQCAVALQRVRMTQELVIKEKMDRELAVAREIQMGVLPRKMPALQGYSLYGISRPADQTGGDIFDLIPSSDGGMWLLLGDATGHGVGPAISVTQVRAMLRIARRLESDLDSAFRHINDQLEQDLSDNRFVTVFLGILDPTAHRVTYHSGGQGPLMHFHAATQEFEWRGSTTVALGLLPAFKMKPPQQFDLGPGDILALITDGVFEYENPAGEQFGKERVAELVRTHRAEPLERLAERLLRELRAYGRTSPQADDITIVLVRRD